MFKASFASARNIFSLFIFVGLTSLSAREAQDGEYNQTTIKIPSTNLFVPSKLSKIQLFHDEVDGFSIKKDGDNFPIKSECVDKILHNLSTEQLHLLLGLKAKVEINGQEVIFTRVSSEEAAACVEDLVADDQDLIQLNEEEIEEIACQLQASSYIEVFQYSDGEYGLHLKTRLLGGGVWGWMAGAYLGKFVTHFICHSTILIIGACTGPAAPATIVALEATFLPSIEATSTVVALTCGIAGGVATGPV